MSPIPTPSEIVELRIEVTGDIKMQDQPIVGMGGIASGEAFGVGTLTVENTQA